ncbi:hypothetical protein BH10BDE1_BH10BDE1_10590 [soil metagenome]
MKRISKLLGICGLVLVSVTSHAQDSEQLVSDGQMSITIIGASAIAGLQGAAVARRGYTDSANHSEMQSRSVYNGDASRILLRTEPTLGQTVLRGTAVGDVVRLEYIAGTEASLSQAVDDLRRSSEVWTIRTSELSRQKHLLTERATEARRAYVGIAVDEASKAIRYQSLGEYTALQQELKFVTRTLADADMRMHGAMGYYAAAVKNLRVTKKSPNHQVNQRFHIIQDIYVDGRPNQIDGVLNRLVGETTLVARANQAIPHIRVVRIFVANSDVVKSSVRTMKAGFWALGISAALILEEVTVGEISQTLAEKARVHFSPETRTEPSDVSGASGRRF